MKIAYRHLLSFLKAKPDIDDLSDKLFQLGHEHELENEIFDMEFTPNRGDCLSLLGLARDLNVFYETDLSLKIYEGEIPSLNLNFLNKSVEDCPNISFLKIKIKNPVTTYKDYLENYFLDLKSSKNNFFTDVSNYVAYETGQPTHSYNFNNIQGDFPLIIENNSKFNKFTSLTGKDIDLKGSNLIFVNNEKVINLAGIMGGHDTRCNKSTTTALIECAYFKPESILGTATKYDLHSDASHKFERGVDPLCHESVLRRFIQIVSEHVDIEEVSIYTKNYKQFQELELNFDNQKISNILGVEIKIDLYKEILTKLGFKVDRSIKVPSFRSDISHQNDLAEEVARVIGYNNIPSSNLDIPKSKNMPLNTIEKNIRTILVDNGFYEVINAPFVAIDNKDSISVDNPLDANRSILRTNIIDSLSANLIYNEKRQKDSIKLFEISDIYTFNESIQKKKKLGIIASGRVGKNYEDFSKKIDIPYLKSILDKISSNVNFDIRVISREKLDSKIKLDIIGLEIEIDDLSINLNSIKSGSNLPSEFIQYSPISEFPLTNRDISFAIDDYSKISLLEETLLDFKDGNVKDIFVFDFFENTNQGIVKIGFRFVFQSVNKTLIDKDVDRIMKKVLDLCNKIEGIKIPGMK